MIYYQIRELVLNKNRLTFLVCSPCHLKSSEVYVLIIKYRTVERRLRGRFNTQTTTTKWIYKNLEIVLGFVLT